MFLHLTFENIFSEAFTMQFVELSADNLCNLYMEPRGVDMRKSAVIYGLLIFPFTSD